MGGKWNTQENLHKHGDKRANAQGQEPSQQPWSSEATVQVPPRRITENYTLLYIVHNRSYATRHTLYNILFFSLNSTAVSLN